MVAQVKQYIYIDTMTNFRLMIIRAEAKDHEKACLYIEKGKRNTGRGINSKKIQ
jgi:hypothetical protein